MNILVTGANGFLGTALIKKLDCEKNHVRAFVRNIAKSEHLKSLNVEIFQGNLWSKKSIFKAMEGIDLVLHLASTTAGRWADYFEGTVLGTERMVKAAIHYQVKRFIYVSSVAVYGIPNSNKQGQVTEEAPYASEDLTNYIRSKIEAERIILRYVKENKLPATIIRPGIIYGPRGKIFIPRLGYKITDRFFVLIGINNITMPVTYVDNVADALILAANSDKSIGQCYNVVDDVLFTKKEYLKAMSKNFNGRIYYTRLPYLLAFFLSSITGALGKYVGFLKKVKSLFPVFHLKSCSKNIIYSNLKIKKELGWKPNPNVKEHLLRTFASVENSDS